MLLNMLPAVLLVAVAGGVGLGTVNLFGRTAAVAVLLALLVAGAAGFAFSAVFLS